MFIISFFSNQANPQKGFTGLMSCHSKNAPFHMGISFQCGVFVYRRVDGCVCPPCPTFSLASVQFVQQSSLAQLSAAELDIGSLFLWV